MNNLHAIQSSRLARFGVSQCVDVHCHVLPGIDDGPKNLDESLTLCRSLMRDGITTVIATPHQLGRYDGHNSAAQVLTWSDDVARTAGCTLNGQPIPTASQLMSAALYDE